MLRHYFHATELKAEPELIDGTTEDEQGYNLGALDTTDSYRIVFSDSFIPLSSLPSLCLRSKSVVSPFLGMGEKWELHRTHIGTTTEA